MSPVGTMAHSYVMSFADEQQAFRAFMEDTPENAIMLVDTYDTLDGVRHAIAASRETGVALKGVRLDSGDLLSLSRAARTLLDDAGMQQTTIVASGDLEEHQIARLVRLGAPIDTWGVGTELGTSRDAPALGGVYKLVADAAGNGSGWHPVWKRSPAKATIPGPKQVFRSFSNGTMSGDLVVEATEQRDGLALLERFVARGEIIRRESLQTLRHRALENLRSLPSSLRQTEPACTRPYPVAFSARLLELAPAGRDG